MAEKKQKQKGVNVIPFDVENASSHQLLQEIYKQTQENKKMLSYLNMAIFGSEEDFVEAVTSKERSLSNVLRLLISATFGNDKNIKEILAEGGLISRFPKKSKIFNPLSRT